MRTTRKQLREQRNITKYSVYFGWVSRPHFWSLRWMGSLDLPLAGCAGESILHPVMVIWGILFVQDLLCSVGFNSILNFAWDAMSDKPTSSSQALQCLPNSGDRMGFVEEEQKAFTVDTADNPPDMIQWQHFYLLRAQRQSPRLPHAIVKERLFSHL